MYGMTTITIRQWLGYYGRRTTPANVDVAICYSDYYTRPIPFVQCVQPSTAAGNVTPPAFTAERRASAGCRLAEQESIDISYPPSQQQQTATRCCRDRQTDRRTDTVPLHISRSCRKLCERRVIGSTCSVQFSSCSAYEPLRLRNNAAIDRRLRPGVATWEVTLSARKVVPCVRWSATDAHSL